MGCLLLLYSYSIYFASAKAKFGGEEAFERETNKVFISRKIWLLLLF